MNVNASVAALVALRGVDLTSIRSARLDRDEVRALFEGPGVDVTSVRAVAARRPPLRPRQHRRGRRPAAVAAGAVRVVDLPVRSPRRRARVSGRSSAPPAGKAVGDVGWNGSEIVAFRMHIPSEIPFHNAPSREVQRGNILEWEQPLAERLKGVPLDVEVNMEPESILYTTLLLFGSTIVAGGRSRLVW